MLHFHKKDSFSDTLGFVPVNRFRPTGSNRTKTATAGTNVSEDHESRRTGAPAFAHIRAVAAFANRMEFVCINQVTDVFITLPDRQLHSEPVRLLYPGRLLVHI